MLIYHDERGANMDLNIAGCDAGHEDQFGALRTTIFYYASWIREIEKDELAARESKDAEQS